MSSEAAHLDYETRSELDLEEVGLDVYMNHPSTEVIMAQYARGDRPVKVWEPHKHSQIPAELEDMLLDPFSVVHAWGAQFERAATKFLLKIDKPIREWFCTMAHARYLSLPGKLHDAGEVLKLKESEAKLRTGGGKTGKGAQLIRFFCEPETYGGQEGLFGTTKCTFRNAHTHPKEWEIFVRYGINDVVSERAIGKRCNKFPFPESEREIWFLDQKINETGWPTDLTLVEGAKFITTREQEPQLQRIQDITGLVNPNSRDQVLGWLQERGYVFSSLNKDFTARAMKGECNLTPEAREVLEIREQTSKSSVSKYTKLADMTGPGARLRYQYTYYGAHTGRWASHGANLANLPKPSKPVEKKIHRAVELVRNRDYDAIKHEFENPLEVVSGVLRSAFRAPKGYKFVVADLASIENRGVGVLSRCDPILDVFKTQFVYNGPDYIDPKDDARSIRNGQSFETDPYLMFATRMFDMSYHDLFVEWKIKKDSTKRTVCKPPVLGCGYQLSAGKEIEKDGVKMWTGLRGYAAKMGIMLTQEQADTAVRIFRSSYIEVKQLWYDLERSAAYAIRHPGRLAGVGTPLTARDEEYFQSINRTAHEPLISFLCHGTRVLEMKLPSRRSLFYIDPHVKTLQKDGPRGQYSADTIYYKGKDQKTKQWVDIDTFGGHLLENATQAVCRDILVHGMKLADQRGFEIVGNTYDEIITLAPVNSSLGVRELCECMTTAPDWCGDSFPLDAAGFEDEIYRKDA